MNPIEKILVPTDFSDACGAVLEYACGLAAALDASICVLRVLEDPFPGRRLPRVLHGLAGVFRAV
jgi:nucleotide-binding universal stress UspA family protein